MARSRAARLNTFSIRRIGYLLKGRFASIERQYLVGHLKVSVIMGYDDYQFSPGTQLLQDLLVEGFLEFRILIGGPLIENNDGSVVKISKHQGKAFAFPQRK